MKTVVMSLKQAQWAGMSVSVAGGWIAVGQVRVDRVDGEAVDDGYGRHLMALVPDEWSTHCGEVTPASVVKILRTEAGIWDGIDADTSADANRKADSISA